MGLTRLARIAVLGLLIASLVVVSPDRANAAPTCSSGSAIDDVGGSARGCQQKDQPDTQPKKASVSMEAIWNSRCSSVGPWVPGSTVLVRQDRPAPPKDIQIQGATGGDDWYYEITCRSATGAEVSFFIIAPAGAAPVVDPIALRDEARARIEPPLPEVGASPNGADIIGIVQIPTWFWSAGSWDPITETESQGGVTVTVTATPGSLTFNPGDGNPPVACVGPGVVWAPGMSDDLTDCSYTYSSSSADQPNEEYQTSLVSNWVFTWTLNGADQGEFGDVDTTTDFTYQVGEIQAIEKAG